MQTVLIVVPRIDDGGVEKLISNLIHEIHENSSCSQIVAYVLSLKKGNGRGSVFFPKNTNFINLLHAFWLCFRMGSKLILFSALTPANVFGALMSKIFGVRFYASQHCVVFRKNTIRWVILVKLYKFIYSECVEFIAVSDGILDNLYKIIGKKNKLVRVYNPVLKELINPFVQRTISPQSKQIIFCVLGRLAKQKGYDILLAALEKLYIEGFRNFKLVVAGSGEEETSLKQQVKKAGLQNHVNFVGFITDYETFYKDKDIYLFPSRYEGLGLALIEAMNYGMPVISSDCEFGPAEILEDGQLGILIKKHESPESWYIVLKKLLKQECLNYKIDYSKSLIRFKTSNFIDHLIGFSQNSYV